jgi:two-component system sensor histidine kinase KdpD
VTRQRLGQHGVAAVSVALAAAVSFPLYPIADEVPALLLLAAVAVSGFVGGYGPALLATGAGFLALDYFFEAPPFVFDARVGTWLDLAAFLLVALLVGSLNARLWSARQRALLAREQAVAALEARDEALAIVSHDLRTPLTAIKTSVSTLRNPGTPLTDATRLDLLGTIEAEADRLVHFVSDALAISRLEAGITPDRQWNALGEIVSAVLDRCGPVLGERPITFDVPDTLPLVRFDAGLFDQALSNVLENVGIHTPAGTPVSIIGRIEAAGVRVEVSDAGPGIPLPERDRVFEKFQRLSDGGFGTGLGLAIARAATEAQGGQLRIEDSPLGGACFVLLVPNAVAGEVSDAR